MFWRRVVPSSLGWLNWGQVDTEVMWWIEVCLLYGMVLESVANRSCGRWRGGWDCHKPVGLESSKIDPSQGLMYWGSENNVDDIVYFCGNCCSGRWDYFIIENTCFLLSCREWLRGFHDLLMDSYHPFSCCWGVAQSSMFFSRAGFSGWDANGVEHD